MKNGRYYRKEECNIDDKLMNLIVALVYPKLEYAELLWTKHKQKANRQ